MTKVEVTLSLEVPNNWIEFVTKDSDIFMTNYCGYWIFGMEQDDKLGWLCYQHDEGRSIHEVVAHPEYESVVTQWRAGQPLPEKWHRLDRPAAIKAWVEGVKLWGAAWYDLPATDASSYDEVVQLALLGDVIYG